MTTFKRIATATALVVGATAAVSVMTAGAAHAACNSDGIQLRISNISNLQIQGMGRTPDCTHAQTLKLTIQRDRWWGWEDMASKTMYGGSTWTYLYFTCRGRDSNGYRLLATGTTVGGSAIVKATPKINTDCGA